MSAKNKCWSRRDFLKTVGITGAGSLLAPAMHTGRGRRQNSTGTDPPVRQNRSECIHSFTGRYVQHRLQSDVDETGHEMGRNLLGYGGLLSKRQ